MNCNCVSEIEDRVTKKFKDSGDFKKPVKDVRMKEVAFVFAGNSLTTRTKTNLEVEFEGQKKKPLVSMVHNFCPVCGVRQAPKENGADKDEQ